MSVPVIWVQRDFAPGYEQWWVMMDWPELRKLVPAMQTRNNDNRQIIERYCSGEKGRLLAEEHAQKLRRLFRPEFPTKEGTHEEAIAGSADAAGRTRASDSDSGGRNLQTSDGQEPAVSAPQIPATFPQSSSLVAQGAESADIGKLDTAPQPYCAECGKQRKYNGIICADCGSMKTTDTPPTCKSGVEMGKVNRVEECTCPEKLYDAGCAEPNESDCKLHSEVGSAETGGEKAAPQKAVSPPHPEPISGESAEQYAERMDQNRTYWECVYCKNRWYESSIDLEEILCGCGKGKGRWGVVNGHLLTPEFPTKLSAFSASSGVEGAHEGTTADKAHPHEIAKKIVDANAGERASGGWYIDESAFENLQIDIAEAIHDAGSREPEKLNNAHYDAITCTNDRSAALAESSLSSPPRKLPAGKGLWEVPHYGCDYPQGACDCYDGVASLSSPPHGILAEIYELSLKPAIRAKKPGSLKERMEKIQAICLRAERRAKMQKHDQHLEDLQAAEESGAQYLKSSGFPHKTVPVSVLADIDEEVASLVAHLNTIDGVRTHAACRGTIGQGRPNPYRAYVMVSWTPEALKRLRSEFEIAVEGNGTWGYVYPNFRQSSSLSESGAESAHSGKQNTADKSELLPTQLPKEK